MPNVRASSSAGRVLDGQARSRGGGSKNPDFERIGNQKLTNDD